MTGLDFYGVDAAPPQPLPFHHVTDGSILMRPDLHSGLVKHAGVKIDDLTVLHIAKDGEGLITFLSDSFDVFAAGKPVHVAHQAPLGIDTWGIELRKRELEDGRTRYSLLGGDGMNCEHVAYYIATGQKLSKQVNGVLTAAGLGLLVYAAVKLAK